MCVAVGLEKSRPRRKEEFMSLRLSACCVPCCVLCCLVWPSDAFAQTFVSQGAEPSSGRTFTVQSGDAPPNGTVSGSVSSIVVDPTNSSIMYAGATNGGVWKSIDSGATWLPLTDNQSSLSISSLAIDPGNVNSIVAGIGSTSNGALGSNYIRNGLLEGVLVSKDGGATWTASTGIAAQSLSDVLVNGDTVWAAAYTLNQDEPNLVGGLYNSTDGGTTFHAVTQGSGPGELREGPVTSFVSDPQNASTLYAAVTAHNVGSYDKTSVYRSTDNGATWTEIFSAADSGGTYHPRQADCDKTGARP